MKTLVYIEASPVRGGIEIFAERHIAALRAAGTSVTIARTLREAQQEFAFADEIIVHKCSDVATLAAFPPAKTTYYVHDHEPICPRTTAYTALGNNCRRPGGFLPCIFCALLSKNWKAGLARVLTQRKRKAVMRRFARIVVISQFMKSRLVANGIPAGNIEVRTPEIAPRDPSKAGAPAEEIDILYAGQLIRGKGVHLLLEAFAKLDKSRTLDIVGTGNMEARLRALSQSLGIDDRVRWRGFQPDAQAWMAKARCVVVPSFWQEPYGLVAAEAVALGRKVAAFAIGGLSEACAGKAALVPPGDIDALARAMAET